MHRFERNTSVLVVDDVRAPRRVLRKLLCELGITLVTEAENGATALTELQRATPSLILCDFHLGDMTGVQVLQHVRSSKETAKLPFIIITSEVSAEEAKLAKDAGVSAYLLKPFSLENLAVNIAFALDSAESARAAPESLALGGGLK